jgi:hypothetical protein
MQEMDGQGEYRVHGGELLVVMCFWIHSMLFV